MVERGPPAAAAGGRGRPGRACCRPAATCCWASTTPRRGATTTPSLPVGSTLLLYTDGLVERRGEDLDAGLERLRRFVGDAVGRGLSLEDVCDAVVDRLASDAEDDVALLAVRAHPEDRPRPAEAGPERLPSDSEPDPR
ncbi:hypothetical protein GCM10025868_31500 [Angustibacter aerolatus]|uniref:PPM-type phosphatase domain-containing protein n=1 Tax=Angustibacter aerolatus TaxID=1162965 RepID=A0ABQ6JI41_9ACTN|nr:hypothetical protein GCM10025868_31500 [Angustibacter aerolatus]